MIHHRHVLGQLLLLIGTLGFYGIYWFYVTSKEMLEHEDENITPAGNWTLLAILPLLNIYAYWRFSQKFGQLTGNKYPAAVMTILMLVPPTGIFVSPIGLAIVQIELNRIADQAPQAESGAEAA
ncbi:MAG: DUF4234 domain-containing protein [Chloroflexi bacterium]|nr:DUF4234 domain-containing protein [Chloroflexota bacterium]